MKIMISNSLENEEKEKLLKEEWYHQRFDGCPYLLAYIFIAETKKEERKGIGYAEARCGFFHEHKCDWYLLEKDNKRTTEWFLEECRKDPNFTKKLLKEWKEDEEKYYGMFKKIQNLKLSELTDEELKKLHKEYYEKATNAFSSSSLIDGFALGGDKIIAEKIHNYLEKIGKVKEYNKVFSVLTSPIYLSFENEAEISLLKIAKVCSGNENWKNNPEILDKLKEHQKNYFWIHNNYVDDNILDLEFFKKELEERLNKGNIEETLTHLSEHPKKLKQEKQNLMDEINLPQDIKNLLIYSEDFTKWQDDRKKMTFFNAHYGFRLIEEIGKRLGYSLEELKMLVPTEVDLIFENKILKDEIEKRKTNLMICWTPEGATIIPGKFANEMHEKFLHLDVPETEVIEGLCASVGKVEGRVKLVKSVKEIHKVEEGDILVAVMTRPDYVVGMRKAAAIVTDEGGVTCHAAIVARELKIPCVIGTKYATRILKDGNLVEVDADEGLVRILNKE